MTPHAGIAQPAERHSPTVEGAGSTPAPRTLSPVEQRVNDAPLWRFLAILFALLTLTLFSVIALSQGWLAA